MSEPRPTREHLPTRRRSWIQKVRIDGQTFYCSFGEYEDGRLGEIFIDSHKEGTFARGILSALARMVSISLQCGADITEVIKALRHLNFPPNGEVRGSPTVHACTSVADWIAQEIECAYVKTQGGVSHVGTNS